MMYLSRRILWGERSAEMAGVLPCAIEMTARPQGHGYVIARVDRENPFFPPGTALRGHEFHNSRVIPDPGARETLGGGSPASAGPASWQSLETAYHLARGSGLGGGRDGIVVKNVLASYTHLHAGGAEGWANALVERARRFQDIRPIREGQQ